MHDFDALCAFVERARMPEVAQLIIDGGVDHAGIPGETLRGLPGIAMSLEDALNDLLAAGLCDNKLAGISVFEARVKRLLEAEIERYTRYHETELADLLIDGAAELQEAPPYNHDPRD